VRGNAKGPIKCDGLCYGEGFELASLGHSHTTSDQFKKEHGRLGSVKDALTTGSRGLIAGGIRVADHTELVISEVCLI
jgi:hypothetical protein